MFRGSELRLLASGTLLLVILYVLITRWGGLARPVAGGNDGGSAATPAAAAPQGNQAKPKKPGGATPNKPALTPAPLPKGEGTSMHTPAPLSKGEGIGNAVSEATGPTDEDLDQKVAAREEFSVLTDGSLTLSPIEMEAYYRLVTWVESQSFERLRHRARTNLLYTHFYDEPNKHRGQLVTLHLNIGKAIDSGDDNRLGIDLHEVWGSTDESGNRRYVLIAVDYPHKMPVGMPLDENAEFAGYFLKLQGCGDGKGHSEKVPLLIGRLKWEPRTLPQTDNRLELALAVVVLVVVGVGIGVRLVFWKGKAASRVPAPSRVAYSPSGEATPIDVWLEQEGKGDRSNLPERPDGCCAQIGPVPFSTEREDLDGSSSAPDHNDG
jgi:hypothetical protein